MFIAIRKLLTDLLRNERGNVLIMTGLAAFLLIICVGSAVDMARAQALQARIQSAIDAAGLAAGRLSTPPTGYTQQTWAQAVASKYFNANFPAQYLQSCNAGNFGCQPLQVKATVGGTGDPTCTGTQTICVTASSSQTTYFMNAVGIPNVGVAASTVISLTTNATQNLEVALVLDNTGSMDSVIPGDPSNAKKIDALKCAVAGNAAFAASATPGFCSDPSHPGLDSTGLIATLQAAANNTNKANIYVSIVPFSHTVNVGPQNGTGTATGAMGTGIATGVSIQGMPAYIPCGEPFAPATVEAGCIPPNSPYSAPYYAGAGAFYITGSLPRPRTSGLTPYPGIGQPSTSAPWAPPSAAGMYAGGVSYPDLPAMPSYASPALTSYTSIYGGTTLTTSTGGYANSLGVVGSQSYILNEVVRNVVGKPMPFYPTCEPPVAPGYVVPFDGFSVISTNFVPTNYPDKSTAFCYPVGTTYITPGSGSWLSGKNYLGAGANYPQLNTSPTPAVAAPPNSGVAHVSGALLYSACNPSAILLNGSAGPADPFSFLCNPPIPPATITANFSGIYPFFNAYTGLGDWLPQYDPHATPATQDDPTKQPIPLPQYPSVYIGQPDTSWIDINWDYYAAVSRWGSMWKGCVMVRAPLFFDYTINRSASGLGNRTTSVLGPFMFDGTDGSKFQAYDTTDDPPISGPGNTSNTQLFEQYFYQEPYLSPWVDDDNHTHAHPDFVAPGDLSAAGDDITNPASGTNIVENWQCPTPITPLTQITFNGSTTGLASNVAILATAIQNMVAAGDTNIDLGAAWGWRTISPRWQGLWTLLSSYVDTLTTPVQQHFNGVTGVPQVPAGTPIAAILPHNYTDSTKVIVIMTDGMNHFNDQNYTAYSFLPWGSDILDPVDEPDAERQLDQRTLYTCQQMRNSGIIIYTIGFGHELAFTESNPPLADRETPGNIDQYLLRTCANDLDLTGNHTYFNAANSAGLQVAFQKIAKDITTGLLHISQ